MNQQVAINGDAILFWIPAFLILCVLAIYAIGRIKIVHQQKRYVIERLGVPTKKPFHPGLNILFPLCSVREVVDLRLQKAELESNVKTKDGVFVNIRYVIQYIVNPSDESVLNFVYKVAEPVKQLEWRVENEIRQIITGMTLEELYSQKDTISNKVISDQKQKALETGIEITDVVIEQPVPPNAIVSAMNDVVAAENRRKAAQHEAEAQKIKLIGIAEAEAESKRLQGEGIARQRHEIAQGLEADMKALLNGGMTSEQAIAIMFKTIDADVIVTSSIQKSNSLIFVPNSLGESDSSKISSALTASNLKEVKALAGKLGNIAE